MLSPVRSGRVLFDKAKSSYECWLHPSPAAHCPWPVALGPWPVARWQRGGEGGARERRLCLHVLHTDANTHLPLTILARKLRGGAGVLLCSRTYPSSQVSAYSQTGPQHGLNNKEHLVKQVLSPCLTGERVTQRGPERNYSHTYNEGEIKRAHGQHCPARPPAQEPGPAPRQVWPGGPQEGPGSRGGWG